MSTIDTIAQRLGQVREKIAAAAGNREITLVAVSKFVPVERMQQAYDGGVSNFGENYPQHLSEKWDKFPRAKWHMIGQMQTNKVKYLIGRVEMIQSVDRIALAREIEKRAAAKGLVQKVLVQVNIGREPQKAGVYPDALEELLTQLAEYEHLKVCGLMAVPPADQEASPYFAAMYSLYQRFEKADPRIQMRTLSMGMSHDFEEAIRQGSTMVRVGTAIFGPREKSL